MQEAFRSRRRVGAGALALVVLAPLTVGLLGSPAVAAVPRPAGLDSQSGATAVVLSWKPVRHASEYHVQVATSRSFDDPLLDVETVNTHATPTEVVPPGKVYWRVSASRGGGWSKWSSASFNRARRSGPALAEPQDGDHFRQSSRPPVLRWDPVPGAAGYSVEIDAGQDPDWVDTETYETETTALVPTETQEPGEYSWRVRADFGDGISSAASSARYYIIDPMPAVQIHDTEPTMEDVVLQWDPVPGAVDYELRVSTDNDFNVITDHQYVSGTRYSPQTTYDNASYWWQVRARDVFGQTAEWTAPETQTGVFQRTWPDKPTLLTPANGASVSDDLSLQWTPVQHAAKYVVDVGTDPGFSNSRVFDTCETTQTTYTPGWFRRSPYRVDKCAPGAAGTYYWRVRAVDFNTRVTTRVNGRFSDVGSFQWTPPATSGSLGTVGVQRIKLNGNAAASCATALSSGTCQDVSATPMLDWDPVPGAASYLVYLAHDRNLTNMVEGYGDIGDPDTLYHTTNTRFMPVDALPDTQAGEAYYWIIRACDAQNLCGLTPEEATSAFEKKSPAVKLASPSNGTTIADQVTFDWADYLDTNTAWPGDTLGTPTQTARSYRIQVSQSPSFAKTRDSLLYDEVVDQTTFTAFEDSYPEGTLYWRVQAIDGFGNGLTWSETNSFTKSSPTPTVVSPTEGETVNGVQPFRWQALAYAKYYDLEAYRNADTAASPGNLALKVTNIRQAAYTAPKPLQALGKDFVWRVRRTDYDGHAGAWSAWHHFRVAAKASRLLSPGKRVSKTRGVFAWRASSQAAYYRWELRRGSSLEQYATTSNTAYAPTRALTKGRHTWRVISYDSERHVLRATKWRRVTAR